MELKGQTMIAAPRAKVWAALNDPVILAACIDGVEALEPKGDNRFEGVMNARVGPVRARFSGNIELTDVDAPNAYVIVGEGKGGVAGFAKGQAEVRLADRLLDDGREGTELSYHASSIVGGKLAQLGARLIEGAAKGYAESFFENFKARVEDAGQPVTAPIAEEAPDSDPESGLPPVVWGGLVVLAVAALVVMLVM